MSSWKEGLKTSCSVGGLNRFEKSIVKIRGLVFIEQWGERVDCTDVIWFDLHEL